MIVTGMVAALSIVAFLAGPVLRLAARPLSSSIAAKGLPDLDQRSAVLAADGSTLAVLHDGINRQVLALDQIPELLRQAVVAAEDERFWGHHGYDGEAMARALVANVRAGEVTQGGSTISQQVAKQNFSGGEQSIFRKAKELLYAVALEERLSKEQLLERYLNQVYFGSQAYGVAAAAEEFFGVDVKYLALEQAALLAGLIRAPTALDPRTDTASATIRRNQVLAAMISLRAISPDSAAEAAAKPVEVLPARSAEVAEPFVVEAVKREFLANPAFGRTEAERRQLLLAGGLEIRTTVDPRLQGAARRALGSVSDRLGSALVALDPRSGAILAVHNGGEAAFSQFDVATQGRRPPGSTFKPLAAAAALEAGMPPEPVPGGRWAHPAGLQGCTRAVASRQLRRPPPRSRAPGGRRDQQRQYRLRSDRRRRRSRQDRRRRPPARHRRRGGHGTARDSRPGCRARRSQQRRVAPRAGVRLWDLRRRRRSHASVSHRPGGGSGRPRIVQGQAGSPAGARPSGDRHSR